MLTFLSFYFFPLAGAGADFRPFFEQWVSRPGAPFLSLSNVEVGQAGSAWKVRGSRSGARRARTWVALRRL